MVIARDARMAALRPRLADAFEAAEVERAIEVLVLTELAWHDCYGESTPPAEVMDDILTVAAGDLGRLIRAAHLAVIDRRDLRVWAEST